LIFKIDLLKLHGKGDFLCPQCKIKISPDDETEDAYTILEAKVRYNILEDLMIRCNNCTSKILLTGFNILND
jgi:DNA-directed RNA polymerase subunit RPC12/RpoP